MAGYRGELRVCASCGRPMSVHHIPHQGDQVEVDVCDGCGSVFLDYFDGEPGAVARSIEEAGRFKPRIATTASACPECRVDLVLSPYLEAGGPEIYRCGGCGGAFLLPVQLGAIADYEARPGGAKGVLARLITEVLAIFRRSEG